MKITKQQLRDLETLKDHAIQDIQYGEGGTYNCPDKKHGNSMDNVFDTKEAARAWRAIDFINKLILENK